MAEEPKVVTPPAGTLGTPLETGQSEGNVTQLEQQPLTRNEVLQLVKEAEEKAVRRAQGIVTKTDATIRKEVTKLEEQLAKAGVVLDANQKATLEQQVIDRVLTEETSPTNGTGQPVVQAVEPPIDPISQIADQMMKDAGMVVYDDDPEAKLINMSDPYQFIKSLPAAIEAKKARVATSVQTNPTITPGVSGGGGLTSPYAGKNGFDLLRDWKPKEG